MLESIIKNCNLEHLISIDLGLLDLDIKHSKISFIQKFQNLLTNSNKLGNKENCKVHVNCIESEDFFQFTYTDDGEGIPLKYRDKIFLMFETLESNNWNNTGFGLATVKAIINKLGGNISLKKRSDNKKGVCFEFTLEKIH